MGILNFIHRLRLEKRLRFITSAAISTMLVWTAIEYRFIFGDIQKTIIYFIPAIIITVAILTWLSIWDGIEKIEWLMLPLMPIIFSISAFVFYFLIQARWLTKIPFLIFFFVSLYGLMLSSNIFNVGAIKSLRLYRAASSINYFYQTVIFFLAANIVYVMRNHYLLTASVLFVLSFLMTIQLSWTIKLELNFQKMYFKYALFVSMLIFQTATLISFLPLQPSVFALIMSTAYYILSGYVYHHYDGKLFESTIREYLLVALFVTLVTVLTIKW